MKEPRLFLAFMAVSCLLAACQMENDYEDCILNNIGKAKTEKAALATRAAFNKGSANCSIGCKLANTAAISVCVVCHCNIVWRNVSRNDGDASLNQVGNCCSMKF